MDAEKKGEREIVGHVGQKMRRRHKAPPMMGVDSVISFFFYLKWEKNSDRRIALG